MPAERHRIPGTMPFVMSRAKPYVARPSARITNASLPSADGQYTNDGMNISMSRYGRSVGGGAKRHTARQNSRVPAKLNAANTKKAASSDAGITVYTKPVISRMNEVPV